MKMVIQKKKRQSLQSVAGQAAKQKLGVTHYSKISKNRWATFYKARAAAFGITVAQYKKLPRAEIKAGLAKAASKAKPKSK